MEHIVGAFAGSAACLEVPDVTFDHSEVRNAVEWIPEHFVQVRAMPSREVVDADNRLTEGEQLLKEIGADETGDACHDPYLRSRNQMFA
jgi:hypothetical protein